MIAGIFHQGSGLGNQLFRYITTRTLAEDKGSKWGMIYKPDGSGKEEGFKGKFFLEQPMFVSPEADGFTLWEEKKVIENGVDIRGYDPEINFIKDNTIIEGEFQDERYWGHRINDIDQWLKVEPLKVPNDVCVIGFRGGEFAVYPDLFLTKEWWTDAIGYMTATTGITKFDIHTDDENLARSFFSQILPWPDFRVIHDVGINWRSMRYADNAIISNSSFYILPRLLNSGLTIAPRYWARNNTKVWALPQNYYEQFTYI